MSTILHHILDTVTTMASQGRRPICIFDIDGTLLMTRARTVSILNDFAKHTQNEALRAAISSISNDEQQYTIFDPLQARISLTKPERRAILNWWKDRFFTSDWCREDPIIAGGPAFVNACHQRGALVYYLTGRHHPDMAPGTVECLLKRGFPLLDGRAILQLKADVDQNDEQYKAAAIGEINRLGGTVVATFENEPGNANLFAAHFSQATHVLVGNTHRPDAPPPRSDLVRVHDFSM